MSRNTIFVLMYMFRTQYPGLCRGVELVSYTNMEES
jgi:hypothetical protein